MLLTILIFLIVISLLVFVHELGHFMTARRLGVTVEEFGFGFPPRIWGFKKRGTIYSLNWIPFGGFVRLKGETPGTNVEPDSFAAQPRHRRFAILAAGVVMNYLLTFVVFTIGLTVGIPAATSGTANDSRVRDPQPQIVSLDPTGVAAQAGLKTGDKVLRANDTPITSSTDLKTFQQTNAGQPFNLVAKRGGNELTVTLTPRQVDDEYRIGVGIVSVGTLREPFPQSVWYGLQATIDTTGQIFSSFGTLLKDLVVERKVAQDLSGPVGIVVLTGQAVDLGFGYLLQFIGLLSATLAVVNFFPLPALDGGRALFVIIEAIRRKAVDHRIESLVHAVGFYLLLALVLLVSIHDVQRFGITSRFMDGLKTVFGG